MDPVFLAMLAKLGIDTVVGLVKSWQASGEPTEEQIREAFLTLRPEDYLKTPAV